MHPKIDPEKLKALALQHPDCPGELLHKQRDGFVAGFVAGHNHAKPPGEYADGEIVWQADYCDGLLVVVCQRLVDATNYALQHVEGNYPIDFMMKDSIAFATETEACAMANALVLDLVDDEEAFDTMYEMPASFGAGAVIFWRRPVDDALIFYVNRRLVGQKKGLLQTPGGCVEEGETYSCAVRRELYEETGLLIARDRFRIGDKFRGENDQGTYDFQFFHVELQADEVPGNTEPLKHSDWEPMTIDQLRKRDDLMAFLLEEAERVVVNNPPIRK